ncbi:unnamed protein product [Enterobius vermicularis]|uniref:B30.2/SPRY domain-containing protein n=1 Tax=Enterobius vermicularis TaxID=51028 RepID=A0A0N4V9V2_ENTVE|nr:unnamed protein product [Enterobius vermicularis]
MEKYVLQISRKEATVCGQFIAFHTDYSNGTVAVRGDRQLDADSIAYWEINVPHRLFGTSVMFGVGSKLAKCSLRYRFTNLLGSDEHSYGLSYNGQIYHNGIGVRFCNAFQDPCVLSVLFYGPSASIAFFLNGAPLGWAFTQINLNQPLYPMISR